MNGVFMDASVLRGKEQDEKLKVSVQQEKIRFEFPQGFTQLRLIEECRALNALDVSDPDNFDLMYDITMQMLVGKPVYIQMRNYKEELVALGNPFVVTDRYMDLRGVEIINAYPILVNWLVKFVSGHLKKKFPLQYISKEAENKKEEKKTQTKKSKKA